jgi:hypothetical protein
MPESPSEQAAPQTGAMRPADTQPLKVPEELRALARGNDTGKFSSSEILARLESGRTEVDKSGAGSTLRIAHVNEPPEDRRQPFRTGGLPQGAPDRRTYTPLNVPALFPAKGQLLLLVVGGFADDRAMGEEVPYWRDDEEGGSLIWQALAKAGLLEHQGRSLALGQGGFWEETPPPTRGLAMTYVGFRRRGEVVDFEQIIKPWNLRRMQVLVQECDERSGGRLKVVTIGESARFMTCATMFALPGIPLLSLPEPGRGPTSQRHRPEAEARDRWVEWAADLMSVGGSGA